METYTNEQGQVVKNSDAVRARNARKRAKLKAKARGETVSTKSFWFVVKEYTEWKHLCTRLICDDDDSNQAHCADLIGESCDRTCISCKTSHTYESAVTWVTGFELPSHATEYINVFFSRIKELGEVKGLVTEHVVAERMARVSLFVRMGNEVRSTTWEDVTDVETVVADAIAAVSTLGQSLSPATL